MSSTSKRNNFFDNAKFILIFLVVFGHLISPLKEQDGILFTLYTVIFLFHMPAFILISGYFAKGYKKKGYLLKSVKKNINPLFYLSNHLFDLLLFYRQGRAVKF